MHDYSNNTHACKQAKAEAKEDVEKVEKLETAEGIDSQPLMQGRQVPEETSNLTESKVVGSIAKDARNEDNAKNGVQDQPNSGEEQTGEFGPAALAHPQ